MYYSGNQAARAISCTSSVFREYLKSGKIIKGIYLLPLPPPLRGSKVDSNSNKVVNSLKVAISEIAGGFPQGIRRKFYTFL